MKRHKLFAADHMVSEVIENIESEQEEIITYPHIQEALGTADSLRMGISISVMQNVAIVTASGALVPGEEVFHEMAGLVTYGSVASAVELASEIEGVDAVILDLDSPGGTVTASAEASRRLTAAAKNTKLVAHTSTGAFSGAFMLAAATGDIRVSETAGVGSIGVKLTHENVSEMLKENGIEITELSIGSKKTLGSPFKALSDEDKENIMADLQESFDMFVSIVHDGIGMSEEAIVATEAGIFVGKSAVNAGLASEVITLDELIVELHSGTFSGSNESETGLNNLTQSNEAIMTTEETTVEATAEVETVEAVATEEVVTADTYMQDVMVKLATLERLDAMPSIVEQGIAVDDIEAELSYENDVKALCSVAGVDASADAEAFLEAKMSITAVKSALFDKMVANAEATHVDSSRADAVPEQTAPKLMSVNEIFNARKGNTSNRRSK